MIGRDLAAVLLVREPGIARDLADAGQVGAERVGQRLDARRALAVGVAVVARGRRRAPARRPGTAPARGSPAAGSNDSGVLKAKRVRSALALSPRSPCSARWKKAARLGTCGTSSSRMSVVGRCDALDRLHRKAREMRGALSSAGCARAPTARRSRPTNRRGRLALSALSCSGWSIAERIVGGDHGDGEIVEIGIAQADRPCAPPGPPAPPAARGRPGSGRRNARARQSPWRGYGRRRRPRSRPRACRRSRRAPARSIRAPDCRAPAAAGARPG